MDSHPSGFEDLLDRLATLETENRRFKLLGVATLVGVALLLVMGQAPAKKTVEANEFILRDDGGNIRARLFITEKMTTTMTLPGMTTPTPVTWNPKATLALYDDKGQTRALLDDGSITFENSGGKLNAQLGHSTVLVAGDGDSGALMAPGFVSAFDERGFSADLGIVSLETPRTGETHKTTSASLVLFDKSKNVIWKAP